MAYNYATLGGTRVQNDLRTLGYFSGTATGVVSSGMAPYVGGRSLVITSPGTVTTTFPGQTTDYFSFQLSTKTIAQLYTQGGWAISWKAMAWIPNSCSSNITWDGTNYWMPTTSTVTGNWIGKSATGYDWNFVQVNGSNGTSTATPIGFNFQNTYVYADTVSGTGTVLRYMNAGSTSMTQTTVSSTAYVLNTATITSNRIALGSASAGVILASSAITGPWTSYVVGGSTIQWRSSATIPGTTVMVFGGSSGRVAVSTDACATAPTSQAIAATAHYFNGIAASATSVVAVSAASTSPFNTIFRSIDQGQTYAAVAQSGTVAFGQLSGIAYGNGVYVAVSGSVSSLIVSTDDGVTWTAIANPFPTLTVYSNVSFDTIRFQNGKFWLCTSGNSQNNYLLATSVDGVNWEIIISAPPAATGGTTANYVRSVHGVFAAVNSNGTPTSAIGTDGFGTSTIVPGQFVTPLVVVNQAIGASFTTVQFSVNQWLEYQIVAHRGTTTNEWAMSFSVAGVVQGPAQTTRYAAVPNSTLWFNLFRSAPWAITSDIVFYEFASPSDPGTIGPDLRVYYDQPATDDTPLDWVSSTGGASHTSQVAVPSLTSATTYVYESGVPATDQYAFGTTTVPSGYKVLSTRNTAYFSRMSADTSYATVGVVNGSTTTELAPTNIVSQVGSWTVLQQQLDTNPATGGSWTTTTLNSSKIRIGRRNST